MNIEHMRTFLEVSSSGSFQASAEKLHVTQSTVSARIKALEEQLNQALIIRKRNGCELTTAGRLFHKHAVAAVQAWERARQEIALPDDMTGVFSFGIQTNHWDYIAPKWLDIMSQTEPSIATRVISDYSDPLMAQLRDGHIDMAILYRPIHQPNIHIEQLMDDKLILVATEPRTLEMGRVDGYVFVDWGDEFRAQHNLAFPKAYIPKISFGVAPIALSHILKHSGSGYFLEGSIKHMLEDETLFQVKNSPVFSRPTYLGYPTNATNSKLHKAAIRALRKIVN
ncbi:MAG: LysR family transcriptional regulator [Gammaproteobacteria bacterium]